MVKAVRFNIMLILALNVMAMMTSCGAKGKDCDCAKKVAAITNPLPMKIGDPYLMRAKDGNFYMYGTSPADGFEVYMTNDFVKWQDCGQVYNGGGSDQWNSNRFWSPEVFERNGKYYLFYSANDKSGSSGENYKVGVAVSLSPIGPFSDLYNRPIFDPGYSIIDANVYFDDTSGKAYLYYTRCGNAKVPKESEMESRDNRPDESGSLICVVELKSDFSGVIGKPRTLLEPTASMRYDGGYGGTHVFKDGNVIYMTYSERMDSEQSYNMGYAMSANPLGPFRKAGNNPLLQENQSRGGMVSTVGHGMVIAMPGGDMYCVYSGRITKSSRDWGVMMDRLAIGKDNLLTIDGPTVGTLKITYN